MEAVISLNFSITPNFHVFFKVIANYRLFTHCHIDRNFSFNLANKCIFV